MSPIMTRESDGLRFEPTVQPGMVRCEACLELVEPSQIREHVCRDWWNLDMATAGRDAGAGRSTTIFRQRRAPRAGDV